MPRILWLCALVCLLVSEQNTLQAQETWQIQHIIDNDDYVLGVQQSHQNANAPRDNRGLALSYDHQYLYLGYNNPPDKRLVRKIFLQVKDPANNRLAVVAQLALATASTPAKAIATDDRGRVYLARGRVIEIYDTDLSERLYSLAGFETCEGIAVARLSGKLVAYASDRTRGTLTRFEISEWEGAALRNVVPSGFDGDGQIPITNSRSLRGLAVQSNGLVWIADHEAGKVFRVYSDGRISSTAVRNAIDVALDEKREEVFVTQDTSRTIAVLRLTDGSFSRTIKPPLAELKLSQEHAELALAGVEVIPNQRLFVSNESGRSIKVGATGDSPFSDADDSDIIFGDDNDPVLVMKFSFTVDAGVDREIALGQSATLGGNPTVRGGQPPYRYRWAPLEGLNDNTLSNPIAKPGRSMTYNLIVTDKAGSVAQDQVTITVPTYVFLAHNFVFFGGNENSVGNIYANGPITFAEGLPGVHRGDLTAGGDILLYEKNLVVGDIKTGGKLLLRGDAKVEGEKLERAEVLKVSLPEFAFQAGGANLTVTEESALAPGSYGRVRLAPQAVLHLQNGEYYFEKLTAQNSSRLVFENAAAPTFLYITSALSFGNNVKMHLAQTEGASTTQVHFNVLQKGNIEIGEGTVVLGNLRAPGAHVSFAPGSRLLGSVTAEAITLAKNVAFHVHPSSTQELVELMPIYFSQEPPPITVTASPRKSRPVMRDTTSILPPTVAPVDTLPADTTQAVFEPDTVIIPKAKPVRGNKLVPILVGLILLGLLLLLFFLLLRRKHALRQTDYWQVQQTRRTPKKHWQIKSQKKDPKRHWRIRSRR